MRAILRSIALLAVGANICILSHLSGVIYEGRIQNLGLFGVLYDALINFVGTYVPNIFRLVAPTLPWTHLLIASDLLVFTIFSAIGFATIAAAAGFEERRINASNLFIASESPLTRLSDEAAQSQLTLRRENRKGIKLKRNASRFAGIVVASLAGFGIFAVASSPKIWDDIGISDYESSTALEDYVPEQAQLSMPLALLRDPLKEGRRVALLTDDWFYCYPRSGELYRVPRGYLTDFASIPAWARVLINPFGQHAEAAVIHDWLYAVGEQERRPHADRIFLHAMKEQRVSFLSRNIMHRAVRIGGNPPYGAEREWRFYDPSTLKAASAPFEKPINAAVDGVNCAEFEENYFEYSRKFRSY